jgi:hypothetical protein
MIDDQALGVTANDWPLHTSRIQTLHENRQPIFIPPDDLDSVTSSIDKHEVAALADATCEFRLNHRVQANIRSSHIEIVPNFKINYSSRQLNLLGQSGNNKVR